MVDKSFIRENLEWFLLSFVLVSFATFFSYMIYPSQASILAISFAVIAITPHFYNMMDKEEALVAHCAGKMSFFCKYDKIIISFSSIALGILIAYAFWYAYLPSDPAFNEVCSKGDFPCKEAVFSLQMQSPVGLRGLETAVYIMLICFALALFLGAGAILVIAWDLSLLVTEFASGNISAFAYLPQTFAFFLSGLAGALLSFAILRHEWRSHSFFIVLKDSLLLLIISLLILPITYFLYTPTLT